jgi:lysozyme
MNRHVVVIGLSLVAAYMLMPARMFDSEDTPYYEPPDLLDEAAALWDDITDFSGGLMTPAEQQNVTAFLRTIRTAEGTAGPDGYSTMVGGALFRGFHDHPRVLVTINSRGKEIKSSAAGAYQILRGTWDEVRSRLGLTDFSPASQDRAAVELIRRRGALADVRAGRFADALEKCKKEWASLPGAGYGQPEKTFGALFAAYTNAGGNVA